MKKQLKVVLSGTDMTILRIEMRIFFLLVRGGCFFIKNHTAFVTSMNCEALQ